MWLHSFLNRQEISEILRVSEETIKILTQGLERHTDQVAEIAGTQSQLRATYEIDSGESQTEIGWLVAYALAADCESEAWRARYRRGTGVAR
jgi:hypothetical protein